MEGGGISGIWHETDRQVCGADVGKMVPGLSTQARPGMREYKPWAELKQATE